MRFSPQTNRVIALEPIKLEASNRRQKKRFFDDDSFDVYYVAVACFVLEISPFLFALFLLCLKFYQHLHLWQLQSTSLRTATIPWPRCDASLQTWQLKAGSVFTLWWRGRQLKCENTTRLQPPWLDEQLNTSAKHQWAAAAMAWWSAYNTLAPYVSLWETFKFSVLCQILRKS